MDIQKNILLLQSAGLTQREIGEALDCTQANVSAYARGVHGAVRPSNKIVERLRKLLKKQGLSRDLCH